MKTIKSPITLILASYFFIGFFYLSQIIEAPWLFFISVPAAIISGLFSVTFSIINLIKKKNIASSVAVLIISIPLIFFIFLLFPFILFYFSMVE